MENSTPCKYKTVTDIEKPAGIYHYVAESVTTCPGMPGVLSWAAERDGERKMERSSESSVT